MATVVADPVAVLKGLKKKGSATAAQVGTTRAHLDELADEGYVVEAGTVKTGKRGRPPVAFKLTKKGSDKVRRSK